MYFMYQFIHDYPVFSILEKKNKEANKTRPGWQSIGDMYL